MKKHAREGRGAGNGHNDNWINSPLWDNISPKKPVTKQPETKRINDEELTKKERIRRAMQFAY